MIINNSIFNLEEETPSFWIDKTELATSPTTCVHYGTGIADGAMSFANKTEANTWVWNSVHPTVVLNGAVNYYLNRSNLEQKLDGTASVITGADGDVCSSFDPLFWKCYNTDEIFGFDVSHNSFTGSVTAHKFNGTTRKYVHLGMFLMPATAHTVNGTSTQFCSVYDASDLPLGSLTNDAFRTGCTARGNTYCSMTYLSWSMFQIYSLLASGSTDSQTTIGKDLTNVSEYLPVGNTDMLTASGYTESTKGDNTKSLMWLYLANPWGNKLQFISGIKSTTAGTMGVCKDQYDARDVAITDDLPSTWEQFTTPGKTGYVTSVCGENYYPFLSNMGGGSSSTYYCDSQYTYTNKNYCCRVGGYQYDASNSGLFRANVSVGASSSNAISGSRLQVLDVNTV